MMRRHSYAIFLSILCSATCHAQQLPSYMHTAQLSDRFPASWYHYESDQKEALAPFVDHPFIASEVYSSQDEWLTIGTVVSENGRFLKARDRSGRTRDEQQLRTQQDRPANGKRVTVEDPVAHCVFFWIEPQSSPDPIATVFCHARVMRYTDADILTQVLVMQESTTTIDGSTNHCAPLVKREFSGVDAIGMRCNTANDDLKPGRIARMETEIWISPELRETIYSRHENDDHRAKDPHRTVDETALTDIRREDPDPGLFYPPANYRIVSTATMLAAMSPELQTPAEPIQ